MPNTFPDLTHLGGGDCVTGSCHLVRFNGLNVLVDCGLTQGRDEAVAMSGWAVQPEDIDFLFLTHAHIDHIGRVPDLIDQGFRGEIICSHPTRALLRPMLTDALKFTDRSRRRRARMLDRIDEQAWGFEYRRDFDLKKGVRFRLGLAGHILGSAWIRFETPAGGSVLFSGDLGARDTPLLRDPDPPLPSDVLVLESTYGDRSHGDRTGRVARLGEILKRCLADRGKVFIPCFALGRTQELLYELNALRHEQGLDVPVHIDTPLGLELTRVYDDLRRYWDQEAWAMLDQGDHPLHFPGLSAVRDREAHFAVVDAPGPMIVLAGSGMCTGGRILDHLRAGLDDPRNDVLFVGYQAGGTLGRKLLARSGPMAKGRGVVWIDERRVPIRAGIHQLTGYSAHADREGLVDWVRAMGEPPREIRLVHGEARAREGLGQALDTTVLV